MCNTPQICSLNDPKDMDTPTHLVCGFFLSLLRGYRLGNVVPQHSVEPSLADINHLQNAERASTRIFVRQSFGVAPVPRYLDRYDDDVDFPYASSSGSHKRPASNVEALQPPKPKKQKKRATDSGPREFTTPRPRPISDRRSRALNLKERFQRQETRGGSAGE